MLVFLIIIPLNDNYLLVFMMPSNLISKSDNIKVCSKAAGLYNCLLDRKNRQRYRFIDLADESYSFSRYRLNYLERAL